MSLLLIRHDLIMTKFEPKVQHWLPRGRAASMQTQSNTPHTQWRTHVTNECKRHEHREAEVESALERVAAEWAARPFEFQESLQESPLGSPGYAAAAAGDGAGDAPSDCGGVELALASIEAAQAAAAEQGERCIPFMWQLLPVIINQIMQQYSVH